MALVVLSSTFYCIIQNLKFKMLHIRDLCYFNNLLTRRIQIHCSQWKWLNISERAWDVKDRFLYASSVFNSWWWGMGAWLVKGILKRENSPILYGPGCLMGECVKTYFPPSNSPV